jgi:penicillin-binding protein 1C
MSTIDIFYDRINKMKNSNYNFVSSMGKERVVALISKIFFGGVVFGVLLMTFLFVWYGKNLPEPGTLTARDMKLSTKIFDRNKKLLYSVYSDQNRIYTTLDKIPKNLQNATVSIEDKSFYLHGGIDPFGYLRIVKNFITTGRITGGSGITQQLMKNVFFSSERSIRRKIKEFIMSVQVEKKYTKNEILEMYLNEAPYGGTAWGVEAASQLYFGKDVSKLNLVECAILAGMPQSPSFYSPFGTYPKAYQERTVAVLRRMKEDGKITPSEYTKALSDLEKVQFSKFSASFKAAHFVMYVKSLLEEKFGAATVESGGLSVYTTLDLSLQDDVQKIVKDEVAKQADLKVGNGASLVLDSKTREILAMVGSKDYFDKNYDGNVNVLLSLRQPGSSIKPITYAMLLSKGYTASSILMDLKTHFPIDGQADYVPNNYMGDFKGIMQLRFALGNSQNIPAVKALALVGVKNFLSILNDEGMTNLAPTRENLSKYGLALTLGGGEVRAMDLINSFSTFADHGFYKEPVAIEKVLDSKGKVIFQNQEDSQGKKIFGEDTSFIISHILSDDNARAAVFGRGSYLVIPNHTVAVKTGTTDNKKDNWAVGYTPSYTAGVWVGNNDGSAMSPYVESGASGASIIWNKIMSRVLKNQKEEIFPKPSNVEAIEIDAFSGGVVHGGDSKRVEYFINGTEPTPDKSIYRKLKISKNNGKIANSTEIARGEYDEKEFIVLRENDPISQDGRNRWQEAIDEWLKSQSDSKWHSPTEISDSKKDEMTIRINSPHNEDRINLNDVQISAEAFSSKDIKELKVIINGDVKNTYTDRKSFDEKYSLSDGTYEIKVKGKDADGRESEQTIKIGVNRDWNYVQPTVAPTPTNSPVPSVGPSSTPTKTPTPTTP